MYVTQVINLFAGCPLVKTWGLPPLSIIVSDKVEKPIRHNGSPHFVKKILALSLKSQGSG